MSAFIVHEAHIDTLLTVAAQLSVGNRRTVYYGSLPAYRENLAVIGQGLLEENYASVNHRYERNDPPVDYVYTRRPLDIYDGRRDWKIRNIATALKAISCYEYQSCEHPGWRESEAHAFCDSLRGALIASLPGYDDAPWEITDTIAPRVAA